MIKKIITLVLLASSFDAYCDESLSPKLDDIHREIVSDYSNVDHLSAEQFSLLDKDSIVVFDVRELKEYQVSHIVDAIQVDPKLAASEFIKIHGESMVGKTAVFYCSVGRRSSNFISQINLSQTSERTLNSYNLTGGLFHWHNQQNPLVNSEKNTQLIHPYNFYWGRLLQRKPDISYSKESNPA